jgi:hypothetical protein
MRQEELTNVGAPRRRLRPGSLDDEESFKTRRGKVGGFADYLSPEDVAFVEEKVRGELDPLFGYPEERPRTDR